MAGLFYPDRAEHVEEMLTRLVRRAATPTPARAIVVPHAGWQYSGRVAGEVYARVAMPRLAVILGPNHAGLGARGSVMARGRWALPGGDIPISEPLAAGMLTECRLLAADERAHAREHAIEVQLPFLHWLEPQISFVPIALGDTDPAFCREIGHAIAESLRRVPEPVLLVCSTDLNHYESQTISNRKDRLAIDALLSLDAERLHSTVDAHHITMCGIAPALATLATLERLGPARAELIRYETSGDVSGDYDRVVGYAGVMIR